LTFHEALSLQPQALGLFLVNPLIIAELYSSYEKES